MNGERLANELLSLLDEKRNEDVRERLREVADQLGEGGASERAAEIVLEALQEWKCKCCLEYDLNAACRLMCGRSMTFRKALVFEGYAQLAGAAPTILARFFQWGEAATAHQVAKPRRLHRQIAV